MSRSRDLASSGVTSTVLSAKAPSASPTFTGDAVFDTDTLKVDSSGDRVGIGTASPEANSSLHIDSTGYQPLIVNTTSAGGGGLTVRHSNTQKAYFGTAGSTHLSNSSVDDTLIRATNDFKITSGGNTERFKIDSSGSITTPNAEFNGTIGSSALFPSGHIIGVHHSGFNDGQISFPTSGSIINTKSVNFNRVLSNSFFLITVIVCRYRDGSSGRFRSGYTRGVGSLSESYLGQAVGTGEEDGSLWHNVEITYKDTTTGNANDNMYFGNFFSNTGSTAYVRGTAIMVMEVVS